MPPPVTANLEQDDIDVIDWLADERGSTRAGIIRDAVTAYLHGAVTGSGTGQPGTREGQEG